MIRLEDLKLENCLDMSRISMGGNNPDMTQKEADIIASLEQKDEKSDFNPPEPNFQSKPPLSVP